MIHPTAIVDPKADIESDVDIGPYSIIHADVHIGSGTRIGPHVVIEPFVDIAPDCQIFQFASLGGIPQSVDFKGEKTHVKIGRGTTIRECATVHRGTEFGGGITEVGEECFLMAYSHVAHDCIIGRNVFLANAATLAGHITIGDYVFISGLVAIHQFVRIGDYAIVGGSSAVVKDIPPYVMAVGNRVNLHGLNNVGLSRHGFSKETISLLKKAYRILFRSELTLVKAIDQVKADIEQIPEVINLIEFIESSERGITR